MFGMKHAHKIEEQKNVIALLEKQNQQRQSQLNEQNQQIASLEETLSRLLLIGICIGKTMILVIVVKKALKPFARHCFPCLRRGRNYSMTSPDTIRPVQNP